MDILEKLVSALLSVSFGPYTVISYIVLVLAWVFIASKITRNKNLLKNLDKLQPEDRLIALRDEYQGISLKEGISPEHWIRSRIHSYYFMAFIALCLTILLFIIPPMPSPSLQKAEKESRFKVLVNKEDVTFFRVGNKIRTQIILHFKPKTTNNSQAATIFIGFVNIHDPEKLDVKKPNHTTASCLETPSCLGIKEFGIKELDEYKKLRMVVRGNESGDVGDIEDTVFFDIPLKTQRIHIHWIFFQKEADGGTCDIDKSREWNSDGIPYLSVFDKSGVKLSDNCYNSENRIDIQVPTTITKQ